MTQPLQPNILLIHTDQHRYDCLGTNGHPLIRTPHLDRLAAEGVNFRHAFTPCPICVPARASLLTGVWPTEHLSIANADTEAPRPFRENLPTFSQVLNQSGYQLGFVGKWQIHKEKPPQAFGFHDYIDDGQYNSWRASQGLAPQPHTNRWFGEVDPFIRPEQSRLAWGADRTLDLLRTYAAESQPFFLRWDPSEPHLPNIVPEPYASMYSPASIQPWPSFPDPLEGKPYIQSQMRRTWQIDGWSWEQWAPLVSRYLGEISLLDAQVGRLLDELNRLGLAENTLVIYTCDHGDLCGGHGMIDKHYVLYDDVVHVPLLVRWPAFAQAGQHCDAFVCQELDLADTFCEAAGQPVPTGFRGRSLLPLLRGEFSSARQDIFAMYQGNQFGLYSQRMLRDRRWKYVWNATAEDELYDLERDPGELHNLAASSEYLTELARLRRRMVGWMEEVKDPLLNTWNRAQLLENLSR